MSPTIAASDPDDKLPTMGQARAPGSRPLPERYLLNYEDYCTFPDDGKRYEILEGELHVTPAPNTEHQRLSKRLLVRLETMLESTGRGEVFSAPFDVIFSNISICQPDLVVFLPDQGGQLSKRGMEGAPPLVVEILSPSSRSVDRDRKLKLYATHGVVEYWILDPDAQVLEIHELGREPERIHRFVAAKPIHSALVGELGCCIEDLFAPPPWQSR